MLASKKTVGAYAVGRKPLSDFRVASGVGPIGLAGSLEFARMFISKALTGARNIFIGRDRPLELDG